MLSLTVRYRLFVTTDNKPCITGPMLPSALFCSKDFVCRLMSWQIKLFSPTGRRDEQIIRGFSEDGLMDPR